MPFTISGRTSDNKVTFRRDTAVEAVQKAVEMINAGAQDVYITDRERGRPCGGSRATERKTARSKI
jgi:hypothetical protein